MGASDRHKQACQMLHTITGYYEHNDSIEAHTLPGRLGSCVIQ